MPMRQNSIIHFFNGAGLMNEASSEIKTGSCKVLPQ